MRGRNKIISLYWKCQILGWGLFSMIEFTTFLNPPALHPEEVMWYAELCALHFVILIILTHAMRFVFILARLFDLPITKQILFVLLITIVFSIIGAVSYIFLLRLVLRIPVPVRRLFNLDEVFAYTVQLFYRVFTWNLLYFLYRYVRQLRIEEQRKAAAQVEVLELEARALRARMNPHFIFDCLNSIKSLVQDDEKDKSITCLTTFSK